MNQSRIVQQRFRVTGRVQGVFFRLSTRDKALELGVTGVAANMSDGSVEVTAQGTPEQLSALEAFLREGPRLSRVHSLESWPEEVQPGFHGFSTR
jgi:acylphosphatase